MKQSFTLFMLCLALCLACQSRKPTAKINLKSKVQADKKASTLPAYKRIIVVGDEMVELLCAFGDSLRIIAVGKPHSKLAHRNLPSVGYKGSLKAAHITANKGDVVVADLDMVDDKTAEEIEEQGVPCYRLSKPEKLEEMAKYLKELGRILRKEKIASQWNDTLAYNIARIEKICAKKRKDTLRVLYIQARNANAILLNGTGTLQDLMLRVSGMKNAAMQFEGLQALTAETMQHINPDFILISQRTLNNFQGRPQDVPQFTASQAYRMGRVLVLEDNELQGLALRTGKTSLFICRKLYQENFYTALPLLDNLPALHNQDTAPTDSPRHDKVNEVTPSPAKPSPTETDLDDLKGGN